MGGFAVGNYDSPTRTGILGTRQDYIYNVATSPVPHEHRLPGLGQRYRLWDLAQWRHELYDLRWLQHVAVNNVADQGRRSARRTSSIITRPRVNSRTGRRSATPWDKRAVATFTHFEGISSVKRGVYTLNADVGPDRVELRLKARW